MPKLKALLSWSSGKDSAWSLHQLRNGPIDGVEYDVVGLVTIVNDSFDRVSMHGVRRSLLEAQAKAAGLPLWVVEISSPCSNADYEAAMSVLIEYARRAGVTHMAFGDLFLDDVRAYREKQLAGTGISPVFPLWQLPTAEIARDMIGSGLVAHATCVDPRVLPREFAGRRFDESFLKDLPEGVDPCGEKGEFHTFVSEGPMFHQPIPIVVGETLERDGFVYTDLLEPTSA